MYVAYLHETAQMAGTSSWDAIIPARNLPRRMKERTPMLAAVDTYETKKKSTSYDNFMKTMGLSVYNSANMDPMVPTVVTILTAHSYKS